MTIMHPENNVAIFTPSEFTELLRSIKKTINKERLEVLLYTGCRYSEIVDIHKKQNRLVGKTIKVENTKAYKTSKYRYVQLNDPGVRAVDYYLRSKKSLPAQTTWNENLQRWCKDAGIDPTGVSSKSTRKTWESWLAVSYPHQIERIFLSQGHNQLVALKYYLSFPFSDKNKEDMKFYVGGW